MKLMKYSFTIFHIPGKGLVVADTPREFVILVFAVDEELYLAFMSANF